MSSNVSPYLGALATRAEARAYNRGLTRLASNAALSLARIDSTVDLQTAKTDGAVLVTHRGMEGAALVTQLEHQLEAMIPGSGNRVGFIADRGVLALGEIVSDTVITLRRIG